MSKAKKLIGIVFAVLMAVSAFGCGGALAKGETPKPDALQNGTTAFSDGSIKAASDELSAYLFVYFIGDGYEGRSDEEQIYFSVSPNGSSWEPLNNGTPILRSNVGEHGVRDPHIIRKHDGSGFYIIATDLSIGHGHDYVDRPSGWGGSQTAGSRAIIVWESEDLVNWSEPRRCEINRENATDTWAPESVWDEERQQYMVFWSSKTNEDWKYRLYRCYTSDYRTFTEPEVYIEREESYIDATFIKEGEWYYRFTKDEVTKHIIMEKSKSLSGPFLGVNTYSINGEEGIEATRKVGYEGPTAFKMNGEDKWYLLLDGLNENQGYKPFITDNLDEGRFVSATAFNFGGVKFRHGSCIPITGTEYYNLIKKYTQEPARGEGDLVFSLDFDEGDLTSGGTKGTATEPEGSTVTYETGYNSKKAAKLDGSDCIKIGSVEGDHPLKGLTTATISFALKTYAKSWAFYAAANDTAPSGDHEKYLGVLWGDNGANILTVQRWYNSGKRAATADANPFTANEWHHITISFYEDRTVLFVDGLRMASVSANKTLSELLGNTPIAQIGKAQWGSGEYSDMLIDSFKIYNYAMNREQVAELYTAEQAA